MVNNDKETVIKRDGNELLGLEWLGVPVFIADKDGKVAYGLCGTGGP
jgi:hypothetical protein